MKISNVVLFISYPVILAFHFLFDFNKLYLYLISVCFLSILYFFAKKITRNKFGTGDILFGIFQGLAIPFQGVWICLILEVISSALYFYKSKKEKIPFIPFMSFGLIISFLISSLISH